MSILQFNVATELREVGWAVEKKLEHDDVRAAPASEMIGVLAPMIPPPITATSAVCLTDSSGSESRARS